MDFTALFAPITGWMDAHPAVIAWLAGWVGALSVAQTIKQILPPAWDVTTVKRVMHATAMITGGIVSFALWPVATGHPFIFAGLVGTSAPGAYTMLKALIEWRSPRLAELIGWRNVQERNGVTPECPPPCQRPPQ